MAVGGGTSAASLETVASSIARGLEGIAPTNPTASAPARMASCTSSVEVMQQILIRVRIADQIGSAPSARAASQQASVGITGRIERSCACGLSATGMRVSEAAVGGNESVAHEGPTFTA